MFKVQFKLTPAEERGLSDNCVFAGCVYLKTWIYAPQPAGAYSDLLQQLLLLEYLSILSEIWKATSRKFANQLWYLSEGLVNLALFSRRVSSSIKRLMVSAMQNDENEDYNHCGHINVTNGSFKEINLEDFVTAKSAILFQLIGLPDWFLAVYPNLSEDRDDYKRATATVKSLKFVNDHTEREVALIQKYNVIIIHEETQLQFLLQVVEDHRYMYPDSRKKTLSTISGLP